MKEYGFEAKESIKLMRMSKGAYQWEIKLFIADDKSVIERVQRLDKDLRAIYYGDFTDEG